MVKTCVINFFDLHETPRDYCGTKTRIKKAYVTGIYFWKEKTKGYKVQREVHDSNKPFSVYSESVWS